MPASGLPAQSSQTPHSPVSVVFPAPLSGRVPTSNRPPLSSHPFLKLEEEHPHLLLHQLCSLHLRPGPYHLHHAHLQARPGEQDHTQCIRSAFTASDVGGRVCHTPSWALPSGVRANTSGSLSLSLMVAARRLPLLQAAHPH